MILVFIHWWHVKNKTCLRISGDITSFWNRQPTRDDGNYLDSYASFMLNTKPEVPFTDFHAS